jgi:hypothetical protein
MSENYSSQEVDRIVARALKEQAATLTMESVKVELERVWKAIAAANHYKKEFGDQLKTLNEKISAHLQQPMHPGTAEAFQERDHRHDQMMEAFGVDKLTPEQKALTPLIVQDFAADRHRHIEAVEHKQEWWRTTEARIGLAAGLVLAYPSLKEWAHDLWPFVAGILKSLSGR